MNLADAIRMAASEAVVTPTHVLREAHTPHAEQSPIQGMPEFATAENMPEPPQVTAGNVIRLEMFLNSEQMTTMLKALMAGQHSIMTLREAAAFLRIAPTRLLELAETGEVPGILLDGRWRFPRHSLDEWIYQEGMNKESSEKKDVA